MRFLADENLERSIVHALRERGHDIETVPAEGAGTTDRELLGRALDQRRVLLTNDKDFAELTFLQGHAASGIMLLRLARLNSREKALRVLEVVEAHGGRLEGAMTVVEQEATRFRVLPKVR
jgi:predicted nuclease of predicted toxin-antitoxin system